MKIGLLTKIIKLGALTTCCVLFFSGCANKLTVKGDYPTPIIKKLPYILGVNYDKNFTEYKYVESKKDREEWTINIGQAQTKLFSTVLPAMFNDVVVLNSVTGNTAMQGVDLIFSPILTDFQYNMPSETKVQMFEVWMKFNVRVFESDGEPIADWIMTAYGKTPSLIIQTKETALNEAMNVALRDAGARLSLTFVHVPEVRNWLNKQKQSNSEQGVQQSL